MKRVAVVYGGYSGEEVISRKSAALVMNNIDTSLYSPTLILINNAGWFVEIDGKSIPVNKDDFSYQNKDQHHTFDVAFIMIHGSPGEDGLLQGYFEMIGMPFTTGDTLAVSLTFDKFTTNTYLRGKGFHTAQARLIKKDTAWDAQEAADALGLPCFVKPSRGGSSLATFKCNDISEIQSSVAKAFEITDQVIIEEFIAGREFTCGIVVNDGKPLAFPVTEIISENEFFDFEAKYEGKSSEVTPAQIPDELHTRIQTLSVEIFTLLQCKGMSRVDFLYRDDMLFVIEINTVPGFSEASIIPQQAEAHGLSKKSLITMILEG